jgi:hypothetical protein
LATGLQRFADLYVTDDIVIALVHLLQGRHCFLGGGGLQQGEFKPTFAIELVADCLFDDGGRGAHR